NEKNRELYAKCIGFLSTKLNKKQLDDVFECLNGLQDENTCIRALCEQSLETISTKSNDRQLDRVFSAFIPGSRTGFEITPEKLNDKQLEGVFSALPKEKWFYFDSYKR
ncbi:hypothetical protein RFI_35408, partial [Reticulomyxa filosa]